MPFTIIHDLDQLTDAQRKIYADSASVHFGLDPALNPFDFIWMPQESGYRKLCLYARRGTTDILRDKNKISVKSLTQHDGPGYVSFTAVGENIAGRQEIAVGSHSIEGLRGENLAAAVMTAQTRALRRLTLQFVGVGILDVSEVNAPVENEQKAITPIALVPAPVVPLSHEPGKDVTPVVDAKVEFHASSVPAALPEHSGSTLIVVPPTPADIAEKKAINELVKQAEINRQAALDKVNAETTPVEPVKKTRRTRKAKVDLGPSEVPATITTIKQEPAMIVTTPPQTVIVSPIVTESITPSPAPAVLQPIKPRLTLDQVKPFRQRNFKLVSDLEKPLGEGGGGFAPHEGMGISDKMRAFAMLMFTDITNMNELTVEQWEKYLTVLETKLKTEGPVATVKYIEDSIGI